MNHFEKTFWDMQKASISYARDNETIWVGNAIIKEDVDLLIANEKELNITVISQSESDTGGLVNQKKQDMQLLGKDCYRLNRSLSHMAKKTNDQVLLKSVDLSESSLMGGEEREIIIRMNALLSTARGKLNDLAAYGVTAAQLDGLDARLKKLGELPDTISVQSGNRKSATRTIKELINEARVIFDRIDDALEAMISDEKFLDGWFDARKIKGRHRSKSNGNNTGTDEDTPLGE